jgi:hypothetical protein
LSKKQFYQLGALAAVLMAVTTASNMLIAQEGPASKAYEINSHLRDTYSQIVSTPQVSDVQMDQIADDLNKYLGRLQALDASIESLGAGTGDDQLRRSAYRYRAIAWLHGWAILSHLALESSKPSIKPDTRKAFIFLDSEGTQSSSLAILLSVYRQIQIREGSDNPLQHLLQDGTDLIYLLSYQESWRSDRPTGIAHPYYIPSSTDLFGKPSDPPLLDRSVLSLWGLINLQIDTWHELALEPIRTESTAQIKKGPLIVSGTDLSITWIKANNLALSPLAEWMDRLQHNASLDAFGTRPGMLRQRLYKIQRFLEARQELSSPEKLKTILHELSDCRLQTNSDPRTIVGALIEAATPLPVEGGQEEILYDAAIWLRYIMLASYQNENSWVSVGSDSDNSLEKTWVKYKLSGEFSPGHLKRPPAIAVPAGTMPFLRWNAWPIQGTSSAVLADLTTSAYAYLSFDQDRWEQEKVRFSTVTHVVDTKQYSDWVEKSISDLTQAESVLSSYFLAGTVGSSPQPVHLASVNGNLGLPFRKTSTIFEQSRIAYDLSLVRSQLAEEIRVNSLILTAYRLGDPRALAEYLRTLNGISPLSNWNLYSLPEYTFERYSQQLRDAAAELDRLSEQTTADDDLRRLFQQRQVSYEAARDEFEGARLGSRVATQARLLSETFSKIAQLDTKAADLEQSAQELLYKGDVSQEQARALSLKYAIQQRELAEAKVEALLAASQQATELVNQATKELENIKASLLSTAETIHHKKEEEKNRSLINSVITVVGIALAPFTSGASMAIAAQVNQVVNLIDKVKGTNWSNFGDAIATVNDISAQAAQTVNLAAKYGGPEVQTGLKDVQAFLVSSNQAIQDYSQQAKTIYSAITKLPKQQDILKFASAIASGIPIAYDPENQTIKLELDGTGIAPVSAALQSNLAAVLDSGAIMVNDTQKRLEQFSNLPGLVGTDLQGALKSAIDSGFLPPRQELLKGMDFDTAYKNFNDAKKKLIASVDQMSQDESKMLAEALARGAIFVKDTSDKVTAIQSQISPDLQKFQTRLKAYQSDIAQAAVQNVVQGIQKTRDDINTAAQKYVDQNDDDGLANYANSQLPQKVTAIQSQLNVLKNKVEEAQGELEDDKTKESIASYDSDAAQYFVQAGKQKVEEAGVLVGRNQLAQEAALADIERAKLVVAQQDAVTQASAKGVEVAAESLRRAYLQCLARGFDPLSGDKALSDVSSLASNFDGISLLGVVTGAKGKSARSNLLSQKEGDAVSAMVQWISALGLSPSAGSKKNPFSFALDQYAQLIELERKNKWAEVDKMGLDLKDKFEAEAGDVLDVEQAAAENISMKDVIWFDDMKPAAKEYWARDIADPELVKHLLGAFVFEFSIDDVPYDKLVYVPGVQKRQFSYYMSPKDAVVSTDGAVISTSHLDFVLFPPRDAFVNPEEAVGTFPAGGPIKRQFLSVSEAEWLRDIRSSLVKWQKLSLTGAIGSWRVLFYSSTDLSADQKKAFRDQLNLSVRIPYLRVARGSN